MTSKAASSEAHDQLKFSERVQQLANMLLDARQKRQPLRDLDPAILPASLEEAYAVQDAMATRLGVIGGWKVGAPDAEATPIFAPMSLHWGFVSSGDPMPGDHGRMRGIEAEIAFLLHKDLPVREDRYTREEILAALSPAHPAIEVLESAFLDPDAVPRLAMIADLQMNGGFVHGPACEDWQQHDLAVEELEIVVDGVPRWQGTGRNTAGSDPLRLLEYLANEGQYRTGGLQVGQWITTGSLMGKLLVHERSSVIARYAHFGTVAITFGE